MSNTKQQIEEMISDFGEDSISYGEELHTGRVKSDDEIKSDSVELLRKQTEIVEAIDRLVIEARKPYKMKILIPFKDEEGSEELRYTLRSICKNFPHEVILSGDKPDWYIGEWLPVTQNIYPTNGNRWVDAENRILTALESGLLGDEFCLFNDDFFCLQPIEEMPAMNRGRLKPSLEHRSMYTLTQERTKRALIDLGITNPISYELHMPMVMRTELRKALSYTFNKKMLSGSPLLMRSMYGNLYKIESTTTNDVKDTTANDSMMFVSTSDVGWNGDIGNYIRSKFDEPCIYEK